MRVRDIAAAVAALFDEPVSKVSINSCLWVHARGDGCFEQLDQGRYRLRQR
jgi:hypothetical protein